ncbi:MAG: 1-acyl-sn-glycerol-3-phosphate acyltransferase [Calditrichaeota bacterium]|nr:1-acyl-sn-glycerol-3-phosphate acyltransferase [Calditrichota bacterium]
MSDALYKALRLLRCFFRYEVAGLSNLPTTGPALLVANHVGSTGPIMLFFSLPVRFHPWVIADLTDRRRSPSYLLQQFVQPTLHLEGYLGRLLAKLISTITVPLLRNLGCVAVETHSTWTGAAFRRSLSLLFHGRNILIFPEDPALPMDPATMMYPFKFGFVHLCQMYRDRTGLSLPVVPIAVHPFRRHISIGLPQYYEGNGYAETEVAPFATRLHELVRELYLSVPTAPFYTPSK